MSVDAYPAAEIDVCQYLPHTGEVATTHAIGAPARKRGPEAS
jgi:hypothetical protein